jgi:hypothetical protein
MTTVDFSWVKDLADEANKVESERRQKQRRDTECEKQVAMATAPFVEKLHLVISTCAEEFNKYIDNQRGKVLATRVQKRVKRTVNEKDAELSYPEEATYFSFTRKDWTFGIRGCAGHVEFIELPTSEPLSVRIDEVGSSAARTLDAYLDESTQQIGWKEDGHVMDGQAIMSLCREYFKEFIERTT